MELKYYLRGLGLGIVVTALIMGFSLSGKQPMTDDEIIARAKQLGMIEDTVLLADTSEEEEETTEVITNEQPDTDKEDISRVEEIQDKADMVGQEDAEADTAADTKEDAEADTAADTKEDAEADTKADAETDVEETEAEVENEAEIKAETEVADVEAEVQDNADELVTSGASMTITISSGDGSYTVSKKLADIGAVSSAETYDKFLCQNGYDKKIRTGTYTIPADASDEQMARIITGLE
ncbi:MAG: hypothetical protein J6B68_07675 [Lachnospiraceae bacterium]|nr:hypothetical protein [Lachnospiraceae bacterium]